MLRFALMKTVIRQNSFTCPCETGVEFLLKSNSSISSLSILPALQDFLALVCHLNLSIHPP